MYGAMRRPRSEGIMHALQPAGARYVSDFQWKRYLSSVFIPTYGLVVGTHSPYVRCFLVLKRTYPYVEGSWYIPVFGRRYPNAQRPVPDILPMCKKKAPMFFLGASKSEIK